MRHRLPHAAVLALAMAIAGCAGMDPAGPDGQYTGLSAGSGLTLDASSYLLEADWVGLKTVIGISFTNRSPRTMYIVNCQGGLSTTLEKRIDDRWVPYWSPTMLMCLTPPITIKPGATLTRSVTVWGALPGHNAGPEWASDDVAGTYRMVLGSVVWNYTTKGQRFGDPVPLELRTSGEFELRR